MRSRSAFRGLARRLTRVLSNDAYPSIAFEKALLHEADFVYSLLAQLFQQILFGHQFGSKIPIQEFAISNEEQ